MTKSLAAQEAFRTGFSCAQAVFTVFAGKYGLPAAVSNRIACGFGGGIAHRSLTCGAVSGAVLVIGLKHGKAAPDDNAAKDKTYADVNELFLRFEERFESSNCGELTGLDLATGDGLRKFRENNVRDQRCMKFVDAACEILESMGY